jgi:hypothetical protein
MGAQMRVFLFLLISSFLLAACSDNGVSVDTRNLSAEESTCLYAANAMIDVAREAVNEPRSRPERRESRRLLMQDWVARLEAGETPCSVYADIMASATTF